MKIENWSLCVVRPDPYKPPEAQPKSLQGNVWGHSRFEDGTHITTSTVVGLTDEGLVMTNTGSKYELGTVDPEYEKAFPDARNRVFKALS